MNRGLFTLLPAVSRSITGCRPAIGGEEQTRYTGKYYPPPLCFAQQNIGEVARSDGGVNPYSKKTYEIFSTPLLRNYRFFGVSPIPLMQLPVMLRDTVGEKKDLTSPTVSGVLMGRVGSLKTGFISSAFSE